jgi:hypothetical protein
MPSSTGIHDLSSNPQHCGKKERMTFMRLRVLCLLFASVILSWERITKLVTTVFPPLKENDGHGMAEYIMDEKLEPLHVKEV